MIDLTEADAGMLAAFAVRYCIPRHTLANREVSRITWQLYCDGVLTDHWMRLICDELRSVPDLDPQLQRLLNQWDNR